MISDKLIPLLEQKFGPGSFNRCAAPYLVVSFPPAHNLVGELRVFEYGKEIVVEIGKVAHNQFDNLNPEVTPDEAEQELAEQVASFIEDIFAGRYLFWFSRQTDAGGLKYMDSHLDNEHVPLFDEDKVYFTWSGPMQSGAVTG